MGTGIEWTDETWNPVTGCSKVSAGCTNCYAEKLSHRFKMTTKPWNAAYAAENVKIHEDRLDIPFTWRKPRRVFVNSMSDLFHEQVPDWFVGQVFIRMAMAPEHTFQILTKRPERMRDIVSRIPEMYNGRIYVDGFHRNWPLPNVWLGVSVENQEAADSRIPLLLQTPAAVRFLSCEPLLGPVDISAPGMGLHCESCVHRAAHWCVDPVIHWVIVGGESGPNARPMHPDWVRSLKDQCVEAGVPFFFKQWGEWLPNAQEYGANPGDFNYERKHVMVGEIPMCRAGKKKAGRMLDGRTWDEFPTFAVR